MNFINKLIKGLAYLPTILIGVEHVFGPKQGTTKRAQAEEIFNSIVGTAEAVANKDLIDEKLFNEGKDQAIEGLVKCFNATGVFKKKA